MKQLIQSLRTGKAQVLDVPAPRPGANDILVRNRASVISSGTERMVLEFSQRTLLGKARSRPDLVRQVLDKAKRDGLIAAFHSVHTRLDQPIALGYSSAGEVVAVGSSVREFHVGDRVACGGGGFAAHAEIVRVPRTLAARIPEANRGVKPISFEEAGFATIGSIALHGLRLGAPQLGETIAVIGLGVIGLIAVQLARAGGCHVLGMDPDRQRCELARRLGCDRIASAAQELEILAAEITQGVGVDVVLVAANSESSQPLELAAAIARDRARVICIGSTGMELPRKIFYEKELDFKISRAYGPGRYDSGYEDEGRDYPLGYVRWTEGRNLAAFLDLLSQGKIEVGPLISHRFPISSAEEAYELISGDEPSLGVVLQYSGDSELLTTTPIQPAANATKRGSESIVRIGLLGAGNFVHSTLLPAMKQVAATEFVAVCAASGISAVHASRKAGFRFATTDPDRVLADPEINTIVIATRHHQHASQITAALRAGKHVFCEKPLCLAEEELDEIITAYRAANEVSAPILMVGFNRRFAPLIVELKRFLQDIHEPVVMNYRVNAGIIPASHWTQDPQIGGGRIIGEACHFIDLMSFLCNSEPVQVFATSTPDSGRYRSDNVIIQLSFGNGSTGVLTYAANGDRSLPKERLEVFAQGRTAILNDFRSLELASHGHRRKLRSFRADKGHRAEWRAMTGAVLAGGPSPIPFTDVVNITIATFRAVESLQSGKPEPVALKFAERE